MKRAMGLSVVLVFTLACAALAVLPEEISYQGVLKQEAGVIVPDGEYGITFSLYDTPMGGLALWVEVDTVTVVGGVFDVILGKKTSLDLGFDQPYWLAVAVGEDSELTPRVQLTAAPYAFRAAMADSLSGMSGWSDDDWEYSGENIYRLLGMVGIGTADPNRKLHIYEDINNVTGIIIENPNPGSSSMERITFKDENGELAYIAVYDDDSGIYPNAMNIANSRPWGSIRFRTGGAEKMRIANSGRVGIGTQDPAELLDVAGTAKMGGFQLTAFPSAGYVLTSDASGVGTWQPPGEFTLPYEGSVATGGDPAFKVVNTGFGKAGDFCIESILSTESALHAQTDGLGCALSAVHSGPGTAGSFLNSDSGNNLPALEVVTEGTGYALKATSLYGLQAASFEGSVHINGSTVVLAGDTSERAGYFESSYGSSSTHVIEGYYAGSGPYDAKAVYGNCVPQDSRGTGGYFLGGHIGVEAYVNPTGNQTYYGVMATVAGGSGDNIGVLGEANGSGENIGILGSAFGGTVNYAGWFGGDVHVTGNLSKGGGSFKIDHPLDPENRYLYHSFVESPDMMNVYNGNVLLDGRGEAWIEMPEWFETLNRDFRYQLTCIGGFAPVFVAEKIESNRFKIAGGEPDMEVSWQVTGVRQDPYAQMHRIPVEEDKVGRERGRYLHPDAYGLPVERGVDYREDRKPRSD